DAMAEKNYGAVVIMEDGQVAGIFTERDLLRRIAAGRMDIEKTKISDVMTSNVRTAKINDKVSDSLRRMSQGRFRHMPVIDDNGDLMGMLSQGDFVAFTMSDAIYRASINAKASIYEGNSTPFSLIIAILVYTIVLLFTVSALSYLASG
ncbi:MAG: CBS domain-containing protein, partial [Pseudomonadota bacterium]